MKKKILDVEGNEIPLYTIRKKLYWKTFLNTSPVIAAIAFTIIVAFVVFLWWLSIFLLMVGLNWIFNTTLFTFWKTFVLSLILGALRISIKHN